LLAGLQREAWDGIAGTGTGRGKKPWLRREVDEREGNEIETIKFLGL